jgi:hypothetical protein
VNPVNALVYAFAALGLILGLIGIAAAIGYRIGASRPTLKDLSIDDVQGLTVGDLVRDHELWRKAVERWPSLRDEARRSG